MDPVVSRVQIQSLHPYALMAAGAALAAILSVQAWVGHPVMTIALVLLPAAMTMAPLRLGPFLIAGVYFGVGNRDIPWMVQRFFEADHGAVLSFVGGWVACALLTLLQALPFLLVSPLRSSRHRFWSFVAALALLTIPPIGLVAWRSPLLAAGALYPGLGIAGVAAAAVLLAGVAAGGVGFRPRTWVHSILVVASISLIPAALALKASNPWPRSMAGWYAMNTQVDPREPRTLEMADGELIAAQLQYALVPGIEVIVLPESTFRPMTTADQVAMNPVDVEARNRGTTILAGEFGHTAAGDGDNRVIAFGLMSGVVDRSRSPMPLGNLRPGFPGSVPARFLAPDTISVRTASGLREVAMSICFEDTVIWPHAGLLTGQADVLVSLGNAWALTGTSAERAQTVSAQLLANLAGVPMVRATNRLPEDAL